MPSPEVVKQCLLYMDMVIKMQMIIFDLSSTIWWSTVAELFIFFYGLCVFFVDASGAALFWMFLPHVLRAVLGLLVIKKMPTMHDMISCVQIKPNEKIALGKIDRVVATGAKESVDLFIQTCGKFLLIYTIVTLVTFVLDMLTIFITVSGLSSAVGPFGRVFAFLLSILYFIISFFFIGWAICVRMRLPVYAQTPVMMALLGLSKKLSLGLETYCVGKGYALPKPSTATPSAGVAAPNKPGGGKAQPQQPQPPQQHQQP